MAHSDHSHDHEHQPVDGGGGLTGYALAKYGIILLIVIAILFFLAQVVIPAFTD
jgi:hypothetical protein